MRRFEDLTHGGQFARIAALARRALPAYPLGPDVRVTRLRHVENTTFRVDDPATQRRYCLRVHRPGYQTTAAIRSELQFLDALRQEADLLVPRPVPTNNGDVLTTASMEGVDGERTVVLFEWVHGRFLRNQLPPASVARSGATLARLHEFATRYKPPEGFIRPRYDGDGFLGRTLAESFADAGDLITDTDREFIQRGYERAVEIRDAVGKSAGTYGLIHADFHRGNFLLAPDSAIAVIDFDDFGWGHFLYDIAVATINYSNNPERATLCDAFLRGYRTVRDFTVGDQRLLPDFHLLRSVFMMQWFITRTDNPRLREWMPRHTSETVRMAKTLLGEQ